MKREKYLLRENFTFPSGLIVIFQYVAMGTGFAVPRHAPPMYSDQASCPGTII
jgi:hypothetical protein